MSHDRLAQRRLCPGRADALLELMHVQKAQHAERLQRELDRSEERRVGKEGRSLRADLFRTNLPSNGFDLVHARFAVTPLDRVTGQIQTYLSLVFFCRAEDGIRDLTVTGVQTCALPILAASRSAACAPAGPTRCSSSCMSRKRSTPSASSASS